MRNIFSVCHRKKLGLIDLSEALLAYGRQFDPDAHYASVYSWSDLGKIFSRPKPGTSIAIIWNNSSFSLAAALVCKLCGVKVVYYLHEPGGLGQKLIKADPFLYSLAASFGEGVFQRVADYVAVPRHDKIAFGDVYLPLLVLEDRPPPSPSPRLVGYVGARHHQRLHPFFASLESLFREAGFTPAYFPSKEHGSSREDKFKFLSNCAVVWNAYGVPLNQSAVTYDCAMSSIPTIATAYEPFREILRGLGLYHEIRLTDGPDAVKKQIRGILESLSGQGARKKADFEARSEFGGSASFRRHWLHFLQSA
jgi:hypothetical protein